MDIKLHEIPVRDIVNGYKDSQEEGVVAYGGLLDVRPKYQREFVYDEKKRNAVIDTVLKDFPLNVMYWAVNGDGTYEVIDGQQRTTDTLHGTDGHTGECLGIGLRVGHNWLVPLDSLLIAACTILGEVANDIAHLTSEL